jgi:hypothetical protein
VHEGELQDTLESIENGHLTFGCGITSDFDLIGLDNGGGRLFCVRLLKKNVSIGASYSFAEHFVAFIFEANFWQLEAFMHRIA